MFRSSTILRELVQSLAKVTLLLKHSVNTPICSEKKAVKFKNYLGSQLFYICNDK